MSTQKVKRLSRTLAYTATWLAGVLTVTTSAAHNLKNGDLVSLQFSNVPQELSNAVVTVTAATTFTVPVPFDNVGYVGTAVMRYYSAGQTGVQSTFSLTKTLDVPGIVQFTAVGAGGAAIILEVSNDDLGWVALATTTLAASAGATGFQTVADNWTKGRLSITSIGALTAIVVTVVA